MVKDTKANRSPEDAAFRLVLIGGGMSVVYWMIIRQLGSSGLALMMALGLFVLLGGLAMWMVLRGQFVTCCGLLAYLVAVEPAMRGSARKLPYLSLEYLIILVAVAAVLQRQAPLRLPTLFLSLYLLLEIAGNGAAASGEDARWMIIMTGARLGLFLLLLRSKLSPAGTIWVLAAYIAGTLGMASMGLQGAFATENEWTAQSNTRAAGGFGPNQVAGLLALGAFATVFLADIDRRVWPRVAYLGLVGVQVLAALLTFTRGGSVILGLGLLLYVLMLLACGRISVAVIGMAVVLAGVAWFAIQLTDQMLLARYQDSSMSGREDIWTLGLRIFWDHPLFGVGTGNFFEASHGQLAGYHGRVGTHNELIRALSEHGLVGASIWIAFVASGLVRVWQEKRGLARAVSLSWLIMAVAFECHSGLKLSMSMFFMALAVEGFRNLTPTPAREVARRISPRVAHASATRLEPGSTTA